MRHGNIETVNISKKTTREVKQDFLAMILIMSICAILTFSGEQKNLIRIIEKEI